jgi:hypothetical protein
MADPRKIAMLATPLVAMATFALGLRLGAQPGIHGALVYGAHLAQGSSALAWQLVTIYEESGVRESIPMDRLMVKARRPEVRAAEGAAAEWSGGSNADGVAEVSLDLPGIREGDAVELEVTAPGETEPLAKGRIDWDVASAPAEEPARVWVRPTRCEGDIALDVALYGERLAPGFASSLWVRATDHASGEPIAGATVHPEPEPGLSLTPVEATTCKLGWAEFQATASAHIVGTALSARVLRGSGERRGEWYGGLPVAPPPSPLAPSPAEPPP